MNWTKELILKNIKECEMGVKMTADILETVKAFEHYSQVNKRFTDRLKELGYHAYINQDKFSATLVCIASADSNQVRTEFRHYSSHCFSKSPLTWDGIKEEVARHNFVERLEQAKARLLVIDTEIEELKELVDYLNRKKFLCFDFYRGTWEMKDALRANGVN